MKQFFYQIIYNRYINYLLRNFFKLFSKTIGGKIKPIPVSGLINININNKQIKLFTNQTSFVSYLIYYNGPENFEYTRIFIELIKSVQTFYDIGANIGYYSLLAFKFNPKVKIRSFEPANGCYYYLNNNIQLNKAHNIRIEKLAISDINGTISFNEVNNAKYKYLKYNLSGEGNISKQNSPKKFIINNVATTTLSEYFKNDTEEKIDLIKIDTEGNEYEILSNSFDLLNEQKPIVICETLFNNNESKFDELFGSLGYNIYNHINGKLFKTNSIQRLEDDFIRDRFFVHPEKEHLIIDFLGN